MIEKVQIKVIIKKYLLALFSGLLSNSYLKLLAVFPK